MLVKLDHFLKVRGEHKQKSVKPPPSYIKVKKTYTSRYQKPHGISQVYTSFQTKPLAATQQVVTWKKYPKLGSTKFRKIRNSPQGDICGKVKRNGQKLGGKNGSSPRIWSICPKISGLPLFFLFWRWDWDHQSYSKEGSGSLGVSDYPWTPSAHEKWRLFYGPPKIWVN